MAGNSILSESNGHKVRTLSDILPETPGLKALFIAKTPAPRSVEAGHYFQGKQGQQFWARLKTYGLLHQTTKFEDDCLLDHGFGLTDIVKEPRSFGSEPSAEEYAAGIARIIHLIELHRPAVIIFVYKRVLDEILRQHFGVRTKSVYGFNPSFNVKFGTQVFAFPLPGTPCTAPTADRVMRELALILGEKDPKANVKQLSSASIAGEARTPAMAARTMTEKPDVAPRSGRRINRDGHETGVNVRSNKDLAKLIVRRFKEKGWSRVPGYNRFGYLSETASAVIVDRESGKNTRIPIKKIEQGISAVRTDSTVYDGGPSKLRQHGITHIGSVVWSLLHLATRAEIYE